RFDGRAAGRVALDEVELRERRIAHLAVGELARQRRAFEGALAPRQLARLPRCEPRAHRRDRLVDDGPRLGRILLEELVEALVDGLADEPLDPGIPELRLRLPLELRHPQLHGDDRCEALADVLALERLVLLEQAELLRAVVQGARERAAEACQVRAALVRVDVVGERVDRLLVGRVPLHRDLDAADVDLVLPLEEDDVLVDRVLGFVDVADEVPDAPLVVELDAVAPGALVDQADQQPPREERRLAETLAKRLEAVLALVEDLAVGQVRDGRARVVGDAGDRHLALRLTACELLPVDLAVAANLRDEPLGERVDDGDADAVKAAGDLVALAAELAAGVQLRQDDRQRRQPLVLDDVDRDARTPVLDGYRIVRMERDLDPVVAAGERLVDGVVDDLVDEVMEAPRAGRADVHARPQPDRLETLENGDVLSGVNRFSHEKSPAIPLFAGCWKCIRNGGRQPPARGRKRPLLQRVRADPRSPGRQSAHGPSPRPRGPAARPAESARGAARPPAPEDGRARSEAPPARPRRERRKAGGGSPRRAARARRPRSTSSC